MVKAHAHVPYLGNSNVVDTRKQLKTATFGATFFASRAQSQASEYDKWQALNDKLKKKLI
ncbi:MAG: hypothetical protein WCN86_00695 [bacterium]